MKATATPIPFAGSMLGTYRHICAFFSSPQEEYDTLLPFVRDGLERGERAFHILPSQNREDHLEHLRSAGIDGTATQRRRRVRYPAHTPRCHHRRATLRDPVLRTAAGVSASGPATQRRAIQAISGMTPVMTYDRAAERQDVEVEESRDEVRRLQGCINDLISVLALPAMWSGQEAAQIVSTLLDVLVGMLRLDFAYARLNDPVGDAPIEMVRLAQPRNPTIRPQEVGQVLNPILGDNRQTWPVRVRNPVGGGDVSIMPLRLGLRGQIGVIVAGSH